MQLPFTSRTWIPLFVAVLTGTASGQSPKAVAIARVTVLDVLGGRNLPDQTVVLENGRISRVGGSASTQPPRGARIIDGRGRWLIPGLWDMHVHLSVPGGEPLLGLYPANGVTGVRDMNDSFPEITAWRRRIGAGELWGPRIVAAGAYLVGGKPPLPHFFIQTAEQGRVAVDSLRALGVDFVKVHNGIPREAYLAIAARVKELGWVYAGHVPQGVTVAEAADAGQRSIEHLTGLPNHCSADESASIKPSGLISFLLGPCNDSDLAPTIARLKANGTWITPTLTVLRTPSVLADSSRPDSTNRYRSEALRRLQTVVMRIPPFTAEQLAAAKFLLGKRQAVVKGLADAGIPILVGTDAPTPGAFPGFAIHDELALLVESGLSPAAALRGATLEVARYLGASDSLGSIEAGKVGDLVLLEADPLADIAATRRIAAVWIAGRMIDGTERRRILDRAEQAARP